MGCAASAEEFDPVKVDAFWQRSEKTPETRAKRTRHDGWKTLRLLVSSTFKDFHNERRLVQDIVEELTQRLARDERILILLEDFNSGTGNRSELDEPQSLYALLSVVEEAREDNAAVFSLHLLGECLGFVLPDSFPDKATLNAFGLETGMSLGEIALLLVGARDPNDPSFLAEIPFLEQKFVEDEHPRQRARYLQEKIKSTADSENVGVYTARTTGINNPHYKHVILTHLETFQRRVEGFFTTRILDLFEYTGGQFDVGEAQRNYALQMPRPPALENEIKKIGQLLSQNKVVVVRGDFGTGKTTVLGGFAKGKKNVVYVPVNSKTRREDIEAAASNASILAIDDADENDLLAVLSLDKKFLLSMRREAKFLSKEGQVFVTTLPSLERHVAKELLAAHIQYIPRTTRGSISEQSRTIADSILDSPLRRNSLHEVEKADGERDVSLSAAKCRILGTLVRFGMPPQTAKALARLNTARFLLLLPLQGLSVCEMELRELESEGKGHLFLSTLCFLSLLDLREIELRHLLNDEEKVLPSSIRRSYQYNFDKPVLGQVAPIRWRHVQLRLAHHFHVVDRDSHLIHLSAAASRAVHKRYLKDEHIASFFKDRLRKFFSQRHYFLDDRRNVVSDLQ